MNHPVYFEKRSRSMATAALVLGIVGLATGCCVYTSIVCGALAIILSLLSRGGEMTMSDRAKIGFGLGIASLVLGLLIIVWAFYVVIAEFGSLGNFMEYYFNLLEGYPQSLESLQDLYNIH